MDDMPKENPFTKRIYEDYSGASSHTVGFAGVPPRSVAIRNDIFQDLCNRVEDIHRTVCVESLPERYAVNILAKLLEDRKCPTDDCKKCKYYEPGSVEPCDINRVVAEYLVYGDYVRVNPPKPGEEY